MIKDVLQRLSSRLGIVKVRQFTDRLRHRLSFVPGLYVVGGLILAQLTLWFDRSLDSSEIPQILTTTVDSARTVFSAIAGGLITSITLLLSMMLVSVQLASSQFSPRTLRDWLGDGVLKNTVGMTLGTTVFSLLALRSTRSFGEDGGETVPHATVIIAVVFGVLSLFAVVRTVDHITQSLRIGSVARRIASDTIGVIEQAEQLRAGQNPKRLPSAGDPDEVGLDHPDVPDDAIAIEAVTSGWIQQIGTTELLQHLPAGATGSVVVPLGSFVSAGTPLMWVSPPFDTDDEEGSERRVSLNGAFAIGNSRTLQQDVGFGVLQLTDIAVRALSPGVNDPNTANDVIVHLGDVLLALWAQPSADSRTSDDDRTLERREPRHAEYLSRAFDPIRRYGRTDPEVLSTLVRTLNLLRSECSRRSLAGPVEPLVDMIDLIVDSADHTGWADHERDELDRLSKLNR